MGEQHLHPSSNADQFSVHHRIGGFGNPFHPGGDLLPRISLSPIRINYGPRKNSSLCMPEG